MLDMLPSLTSILMSGDVTICLMKACKPGHLDKLPGLLSCKAGETVFPLASYVIICDHFMACAHVHCLAGRKGTPSGFHLTLC